MANTTNADYLEGFEDGCIEVVRDRWSRSVATRYLAAVGAPINDYDAGHQAAIRATIVSCIAE